MKLRDTLYLFLSTLIIITGKAATHAAMPGTVVAWGDNGHGESTVPPEAFEGVTMVAAGVFLVALGVARRWFALPRVDT
jgi:hypothetical protein